MKTHSTKQAAKSDWGRGSATWRRAGIANLLGWSKFCLGFTWGEALSRFFTTSSFQFPNNLDFRSENGNYLGPARGLLGECLAFTWGRIIHDVPSGFIAFCLGMNFLRGMLKEVVFRVFFAWAHRFWHFFPCMG